MSQTPNVRAEAPLEPGMRPRPSLAEIGAFLCGLFAFATLALWGFLSWDLPWNIVVGIGAPVIAILVWALFVSPRAVLAVHPFIRAVVELLVYAAATVAWWDLGQIWIGAVFAIIAITCGLFAGRRRFA